MHLRAEEGIFISLEGGEGSGKSTLASYLQQQLQQIGIECLLVREPGATLMGERVRDLILYRGQVDICPMAELLLFLSARAQNLHENIRPALKERRVVICDRYNDSTLAYQAAARGLDPSMVQKLCDLATGGLQPHVTFFLDVDPLIGCQRARDSKQGGDCLDQESLDFHKSVQKAYYKLVLDNPQRIVRLNAQQPKDHFLNEGWGMTKAILDSHLHFSKLSSKAALRFS